MEVLVRNCGRLCPGVYSQLPRTRTQLQVVKCELLCVVVFAAKGFAHTHARMKSHANQAIVSQFVLVDLNTSASRTANIKACPTAWDI